MVPAGVEGVQAGEAVAMGLGKSCAARTMAAIAVLAFAVGGPANQAFAYSATGDGIVFRE